MSVLPIILFIFVYLLVGRRLVLWAMAKLWIANSWNTTLTPGVSDKVFYYFFTLFWPLTLPILLLFSVDWDSHQSHFPALQEKIKQLQKKG